MIYDPDRKSNCLQLKKNEKLKRLVSFGIFILVLFIFLGTAKNVNAVSVDTAISTTSAKHNGPSPTTVFISDQTGYTFYVDGNNSCVYNKTTNGGTSWNGAVTVDAQVDCEGIAVWYDQWTPGDTTGTLIHVATFDSGNDDIYYTNLNTTGDVLSTTIEVTTGQGAALVNGTTTVTITKATNNALFVGTVAAADSFVFRCNATCTTATNWAEAGASPFTNGNDWLMLQPLANADVLAIWWDTSANTIKSREFEDVAGTWQGAWANVDTAANANTVYDATFASTIKKSGTDIYLVYADDANVLGADNDDIKTATYDGSSWTAKTGIFTDVPSRAVTGVSIGYDSNYDDIYVVYTLLESDNAYILSGNVFYTFSRDGMTTWGSEYGPLNTISGDIYGARINLLNTERLYATWYEATVDDLFGEVVVNTVASVDRIYLGASGTQTANITQNTTNNYVGAFTAIRNTSSSNITSIKVSEKGTLNANTYLSNLDIYYETTGTCAYDGSETPFGSASSFTVTDDATVTGTISVGTSQVCIYLVVDAGATGYGSVEFEIAVPSSDVVVSAGNIFPSAELRVPGTTNIVQNTMSNPVTVDNDIISTVTRSIGASPTLVFTTDQIGYSFYTDANGSCVYSKSTDGGASWGGAVTVDSQTDCLGVSIWYDRWTPGDTTGNYIHVVTFDSGSDDLWYTRLDTSTDVLTTTLTSTGANQGGSYVQAQNFPSITKATDGYIYMGMVDNTDSFVIRCLNNCSTLTNNWTEASTNPFTSANSDDLILMPLANADVMAIWRDVSADDILTRVYEDVGNSWGAGWTTVDANADENANFTNTFSATLDKDTNDIYLAYIDDASRTGDSTDDIKTTIYTSGAWSAKTNIATNDTRGLTQIAIGLDALSNEVYVSYSAITDNLRFTSPAIYVKKSSDGMVTWGAETGSYNQTITKEIYGLRSNMHSEFRIYNTWHLGGYNDLLGNTVYDIPASITLSGTVYDAGTSNGLGECNSSTLMIAVRTVNKTHRVVCTTSTGVWSFGSIPQLSAGTGLTVWIDGQTNKGSLSLRYDGTGDSTTNIFYDDTVTVSSDDTNAVTNGLMDNYDSGGDADIPYTVTTNNLTVASGNKLLIKIKSGVANGSAVYDPGGTVTTNATGGDFEVADNSLAYLDTASNSIGRDVIVGNGATLNIDANTTISGGDVTTSGNGTVNRSTGSPLVTVVGSGTFGGGTSAVTFYDLQINSTGTTIINSPFNVNNNFTLGDGSNAHTLDLETNDKAVDVNGTVTISNASILQASSTADFYVGGGWANSGTFTANSSTISFDGSSGTKNINPGASSFNNIDFGAGGGSSATFLLGANLDVNGSLFITSGTLDVDTLNRSINVAKSWDNSGSFSAHSGTVTFDTANTAFIDTGCSDVTNCTSQDFFDLIINKTTSTDTITLSSGHLKIADKLTITTGVLDQGANNLRAEGSAAIAIGTDGTWNELSTGDIQLGGTLVNNGVLTFKSNDSCGSTDEIVISAVSGTPSWGGTGTFEMKDVSISNQNATVPIIVNSSTNGGGNTGTWYFLSGCTAGSLVTDIVDSDGDPIPSPVVSMATKAVNITYQSSNGTFGDTNQKMRISNTTANAPWTMSVAALNGAGAYWNSAGNDYDYNDPTANANDGVDSDGLGGQMTVNPSASTVTPGSGCTNTGLTLGSQGSYDEPGNINSVTLLSASASANYDCYWDLTDVSINQTIPAGQPAQSYSIDMVISAIAN